MHKAVPVMYIEYDSTGIPARSPRPKAGQGNSLLAQTPAYLLYICGAGVYEKKSDENAKI